MPLHCNRYITGRRKQGLEADGILNGAKHEKWHDTNIRQILTNEKYIGDALLQKTYTVSVLDKKRVPNEPRRLSTDIDIIVDRDTDVDGYIEKAGKIFPFVSVEEHKRKGLNDIEKRHFRFHFLSPRTGKEINTRS